jgi:tRNA1(Val) A37 N6-methylase TrmN6
MHAMMSIIYENKLHFAPIGHTPQRILDLGAGSGIWCIDMGDEYPSADITGVDLSANMPQWVPPNVHFEVEDELYVSFELDVRLTSH